MAPIPPMISNHPFLKWWNAKAPFTDGRSNLIMWVASLTHVFYSVTHTTGSSIQCGILVAFTYLGGNWQGMFTILPHVP